MKVTLNSNFAKLKKVDWLVLPIFGNRLETVPDKLPTPILTWAQTLNLSGEWLGELGDVLSFRKVHVSGFANIAFVSLGDKEEVTGFEVRWALSNLVKRINRSKDLHIAVAMEFCSTLLRLSPERAVEAVLEGLELGGYHFQNYKSKKIQTFELSAVVLVSPSLALLEKDVALLSRRAEIAVSATNHARDLVNEPASAMNPTTFCRHVQKTFKNTSVHVTILNKEELTKMKAGGILSVAEGGNEPPAMVKMEYSGDAGSKKKIGLVGKGVMFDSGGYCIKEFPSIAAMKCDMGGGATVVAVMDAVARLKPKINVVALVPCVENLISSKATKPGDIITMMNGSTVEVVNTDAEGRLILGDALHYACQQKVEKLVDLATLTGGCVTALGEEVAGIMSNDKGIEVELTNAAENAGEHLSALPLYRHYFKLFESPIADMGNVGPKWGAAITAGLFLQKFVDKKVKWAHIDIAGPAFTEHGFAYHPKGGTGAMVRTIIKFLLANA
jgi:leucyl aminopeptidase